MIGSEDTCLGRGRWDRRLIAGAVSDAGEEREDRRDSPGFHMMTGIYWVEGGGLTNFTRYSDTLNLEIELKLTYFVFFRPPFVHNYIYARNYFVLLLLILQLYVVGVKKISRIKLKPLIKTSLGEIVCQTRGL